MVERLLILQLLLKSAFEFLAFNLNLNVGNISAVNLVTYMQTFLNQLHIYQL